MLQLEPRRSTATRCVRGGGGLQYDPFGAAHACGNELRLNLFDASHDVLRRYLNDATALFGNTNGRECGMSILQRRADQQLIVMSNEVKGDELHGGSFALMERGLRAA